VVLDISRQPIDGFTAHAATETPTGVIRLAAPPTLKEFADILYSPPRSAGQQNLARVVVHQSLDDNIAVTTCDRLPSTSFGCRIHVHHG
jgi:hypothetical protein